MQQALKTVSVVSQSLRRLPGRLALLAGLFYLEKFAVNLVANFDAGNASPDTYHWVWIAQRVVTRFAMTLAISLTVFALVRPRSDQSLRLERSIEPKPQARWLIVHGLLILLLVPLSEVVYGSSSLHIPVALAVMLFMLCACLAVGAAFRAMAPWRRWHLAARSLGELWIYALLVAATTTAVMHWVQALWSRTAFLTFNLVTHALLPLIPTLRADPADLTLNTGRFAVHISEECSGLEGMGLMLAFATVWLLLFRREYRFPRALLLIPVGLLLVFGLNLMRIVVLVLIGHSGHPDVAIYGFHTQAGWIGFNSAACGMVLLSRRISWLNHDTRAKRESVSNPTAAYLMPFLGVLVAGTLAHALSSGFEILYPLRLLAGLAALVWYRKTLADLDYRWSWRGPLIGVVVFLIWMAVARYRLLPAGMPAVLADLSAPQRDAWIACRAAAAIVTVPIVEELAYRGFLLRRWLNADFERVPFSAVRWPQLVLTALLFGAAHGSMWVPGVIAGALYGAVLIRTGRIGESIAAHATSNTLIAACVLLGGQWQLW